MPMTARIFGGILARLVGAPDLGSTVYDLNESSVTLKTDLASGTGASQADQIFTDTRTIAASGSEELDLAGGLTDPLGTTLTFAKIKAISIKAASGNTNNVVVGGAAANGFLAGFGAANDTLAIPPGGEILLTAPVAGWTVTGGTGDLLKIANSGGTTGVTYDITVIGTSA